MVEVEPPTIISRNETVFLPGEIPFQKFKKTVIIILGVFLLGALFILLLPLFSKKSNAAMIAGTINYTALKPDPTDRGQVQIQYRKYGTNDTYKTIYDSKLQDNAPWPWNSAVSGQPYEMIADLQVDGKLVTTSEPLIVTAPALNQQIDLHVTWHDLPESVVKEQTASIKGTVMVNGYIPPNTKVAIQSKTNVNNNFQSVVTIDPVKPKNDWTWNNTVPLKDYSMRAILYQGTTQLATSEVITAEGGDTEVAFTLNSTALVPNATPTTSPSSTNTAKNPTIAPTQQPTTASITGKVFVNRPINDNTSLLMLWRYPGEKDYKVITRIQNPSHNGQSWSWTNVTIGKQYEITGVLQVNEKNTASTQSQIVTAPAQDINFTLNTGVFIPTPNGNVNVLSCNNIGNNQYNANISFPRQQTAGNYWVQVGRSNAGSDVYNSKIQSNNNNPQITVQIDGNRTYYAQFAYSLCTNCSEDANFSNFSSSSTFSCGGGQVTLVMSAIAQTTHAN